MNKTMLHTQIEPHVPTIAEELENALVRANITEAVLREMMEKALPHARPIETEEQFKEAERARLDIRKVRLIGEKKIDEVDRRYLELRQASLARKKELLEKINEPELLIEVHTTAWKRQKEEEEAERLRQIEAMQEERKALIMGTGATFVPGPPAHKYVLGSTEVTVREVLEADHTTWTNLLRSFEMVAAELAEIKEQQEREQWELAERLQEQERQQQAAAAELERRQREMDEKEAKMREAVNEARKNELLAIGCDAWSERNENGSDYGVIGVGKNASEGFALKISMLHTVEDAKWAAILVEAKEEAEERNLAQQQAQEKAAREALVQERVERLKAAGWLHNPPSVCLELMLPGFTQPQLCDPTCDDHDFEAAVAAGQAELARREAAHQEQLRIEAEAAARVRLEAEQAAAAKAEEERVAKMGDAEKWTAWVAQIQSTAPVMKSDEYMDKVDKVLVRVESLNDPF